MVAHERENTRPKALLGVAARKLLLMVAALLTLVTTAAAVDWATYRNSAYGFAVDYPTQLFASQTFSQIGDGTTLYGKAGLIEFRAYAFNNGDELSLKTVVDITLEDRADMDVSYRRVSDGFAVLSGTLVDSIKGKRIFYKRFQPSENLSRVSAVEFLYPESERDRIDPLIERISKSLTPPSNLD